MHDWYSFLATLSLLMNAGLMIDKYWLEPGRRQELINKAIKKFEDQIPSEKFNYVKSRCPHCLEYMDERKK